MTTPLAKLCAHTMQLTQGQGLSKVYYLGTHKPVADILHTKKTHDHYKPNDGRQENIDTRFIYT